MAARKTAKDKLVPAKQVVTQGPAITLNTVIFKDMVAKSKRAAVNNAMSPLSQMMAIELRDNKLTLITTDSNNYLYIMQDKIEGDDFYVTVMADTFAQLIAKTTSEKITLELQGNALKVVGNGEYLLELPEEEGENIKFPDPRNDVELEPLGDIQLTSVNCIIDSAKASLAQTLEEPCYVNYYCGDKVIATDGEKICSIDLKLWDEARLIPGEVFDLVSLMTSEDIKVSAADDLVMFSTSDCIVLAHSADGIDDYPVDAIDTLLQTQFPSSCKIKKSDLLQLLDRLVLFVTKNDKNVINLTFTKEGVQISSKKSSGVEVVPYTESDNFSEFICSVDIKMLAAQAKSFADDVISLHYGNNTIDPETNEPTATALKFVDNETVFYIALVNEETE